MASVTAGGNSLLACKKCGDSHEKHVNNKYDRVKRRERGIQVVRIKLKTPPNKSPLELSQGDKSAGFSSQYYINIHT